MTWRSTQSLVACFLAAGISGCGHLELSERRCWAGLDADEYWQVDRVESSWVVLLGPRGATRDMPLACLPHVREGMVFRKGKRAQQEERRLAQRVRGLLARLERRQKDGNSKPILIIRPRPP